MARYFITHQTVTLECGTIVVHMKSGTRQHLWLLYTTLKPGLNPVPDVQQPANRPHHYNFALYIEGVIEQEEPGDTIEHTFRFPWPANATTLWFYTINMGVAGLKATRSPIFAYEFSGTPFWRETWLPGPSSVNGFNFQYVVGFNDITAGLYNLQTISAMIPSVSVIPGSATLGNSFSPVMEGFESCGVTVTFTLPANDADPGFTSPYLNLRVAPQTGPGWPVGLIFKTGPADTLPQDVPPPVNNMTIICPPGENTFDINRLLQIRNLQYPTSCPPGPVNITQIEFQGGNHSPQLVYFHRYDFGSLTFLNVNQTPTDVSKYWRSKRLSPKLP